MWETAVESGVLGWVCCGKGLILLIHSCFFFTACSEGIGCCLCIDERICSIINHSSHIILWGNMPFCSELLFSATSETMGSAFLPGCSEICGMGTAGKSTNIPSSEEVNIWDPYQRTSSLRSLGWSSGKKVECGGQGRCQWDSNQVSHTG